MGSSFDAAEARPGHSSAYRCDFAIEMPKGSDTSHDKM